MFRLRSLRVLATAAIPFLVAAFQYALPGSQQNVRSSNSLSHVQTGVDVLEADGFAPLRGRRVGLITNQTGVDSRGRRTIDLLAHARGVKLVALFSPEHGIAGRADAVVENARDAATGLTIYSLYGATRRPTTDMLRGIDALVFDIQDAGVRFYTYVTTMAYCMEESAKQHIAFFVLDRPDPFGGEAIEGPVLDPGRTSFTGYFSMPVRYGMTMGELARMFNAENKIGADLHVVAMRGWHRRESYDQTGLAWIPPSPNLPTLNAMFLYPGIEVLQVGGVSVGRGTNTPFEMIGAPWIRGEELAEALSRRKLSVVTFAPAEFTPSQQAYAGRVCHGVSITIVNRGTFKPMLMGLEIAEALHRLYPEQFQLEKIVGLLGSQSTVDRLERGDEPAAIVEGWSSDLEKFRQLRAKYLLYD
jgi:uncharacterized protein YbbC (DUF1343 family)